MAKARSGKNRIVESYNKNYDYTKNRVTTRQESPITKSP